MRSFLSVTSNCAYCRVEIYIYYYAYLYMANEKLQEGNNQGKAQSEKDCHSKNQGGKQN